MSAVDIRRKRSGRNQSFFEHAEIPRPRIMDPVLTAALWTLLFTIPTIVAAETVNLAYESKFDFMVNFAVLHMIVVYAATALAGIIVGVPLFRLLQRNQMQFGFIYLIVGFIIYGVLFVYLNIAMHMMLYEILTANLGDLFENYRRGIGAFKILWPGFAMLGMAIALTAWARLIKE